MSNAATVKQVLDYIDSHQEEIISFLSEYIQHPSVNPDMQNSEESIACQQWLADQIKAKLGLESVDLWLEKGKYANLAATIRGNGTGRPLLFAGHTDTVPVTQDQNAAWHQDRLPFSGRVTDGKVWGRGAADMKAGNIAAIMAAAAIHGVGLKPAGDIVLTFVCSEESGNRAVGIDGIMQRGYRIPTCIVMEPSNLEVIPAIQGEFYFRLKVFGKSCHIATRHLAIYPSTVASLPGVNAIEKMTLYMDAFREVEREWGLYQRHPLMEPGTMTLNISEIHGGETFSALAETCEIIGSVLYNPVLSREQAIGEFKAVIDRVGAGDYWLRQHPPELELPYFLPDKIGVNVDPNHDLCKILFDSYKDICGRETRLTGSVSTSDGNYLFEQGIDTVTFGPGRFEMGTHGINEYIPVEDLILCTKVYALTMMGWCGLES